MQTSKYRTIMAVAVLVFLAQVFPIMAAESAKVAGEWALTVETPNGSGTPTVTFKQDGETLTGTYKGRFGESPLKGTIKGNDLKFSVKISAQGQEIELQYTGTVDGDSIKGKAQFGEFGEGTFTGKRAAPPQIKTR